MASKEQETIKIDQNQYKWFFNNGKLKKGIAWVCPDLPAGKIEDPSRYHPMSRIPGEFGPPVFDESTNKYYWRHFRRGFSYGFLVGTSLFA